MSKKKSKRPVSKPKSDCKVCKYKDKGYAWCTTVAECSVACYIGEKK